MIGDKIKKSRQEKGYTQEELASKLHVTRQTISKWEKNYSVPDATLLVRLAEIFEVPTSSLLGDGTETNINTDNKDMYAQQLANIAEQMAIRNRRTKKVLKIIGITILIIFIAFIILIISNLMLFSVNTSSGSYGITSGSDGSYTVEVDDYAYEVVGKIENLSDDEQEIMNYYDLSSEVDESLIGEELISDDEIAVFSVKGIDDNDVLIVYNYDQDFYCYEVKSNE